MTPRILTATTVRILRQLRHDRRTIGLLLMVPIVLLTLVYYMYKNAPVLPGAPTVFDRVGLIMLGVFPFVIMFLITSIAMLRERTTGTLERLLTTPLGKLDLLFAYGIAFGVAAAIQASVATSVAYGLLGLRTDGSIGLVILIACANAVLGMALGLFFSAFARTEFQAVQFMPIVVIPQLLLCGLFVARDQMVGWLQGLSKAMPMTYAVEALQEVGGNADPTRTLWRDLGVVVGCIMVALVLAAATLRRRSP
jgi:ABC-2 type transport system permease protein